MSWRLSGRITGEMLMKKSPIVCIAIISAVLLACAVILMAYEPVHDRFFPDKTIGETGNCGKDAEWTFNKTTGKLIISGKGSFGSSGEFSGCTVIRSVVIEDGITEIGENAFSGCSYLKSVSFPDSTQIINANAFFGCKALKSLVLGKNVRSIGSFAFSGCTKLSSLSIPASVEEIGEGVLFLSSQAEIYYAGTKEQWDKIEKESDAEFAGVRVHCNRTIK